MEIIAQQPETSTKRQRRKISVRGVGRVFGKRKRVLVLGGMFALLVVTGYLNFALNTAPDVPTGGPATQNTFASHREERNQFKSKTLAQIDSSLGKDNITDEQRTALKNDHAELIRRKNVVNNAEAAFDLLLGKERSFITFENGHFLVLIDQPADWVYTHKGELKMHICNAYGRPDGAGLTADRIDIQSQKSTSAN